MGCWKAETVAERAWKSDMEAVILIGVRASGKSTFCRERFAETHERINLDTLRTRGREEVALAECISGRKAFVVDNTNPLASDRARYIGRAREAGFRVIGYFFRTTLREAMRRNQGREGKDRIPAAAIAATLKKMQGPEFKEGFDEIYIVEVNERNGFRVNRLEKS